MLRYVVITPVRDEKKHIESTIESMRGQTVLPTEWVVVDDGSTDGTSEVLDRAASELPWIHVIHRANRGFRKNGGGVMEAFRDGYASLHCSDWDFIIKLDADLTFSPDYFQRCFEHFENEPSLGIGGGEIHHEIDGKLKLEELQGGTFSITNGGVFGSLMSTPILNTPQSGILGMHKIQPRPVAIDNKVEIRPMMYLALSYDHRLVDGREAVTFLVRVKENLEDPQRLLLDI